jgi:hypothetical protein
VSIHQFGKNEEPTTVHSVKWRDSDRHEHLYVVRGNDLDEVLLQLRKVKAMISAARAREGTEDVLAA